MNAKSVAQYLIDLCEARGESWREASVKAGMSHGALSAIIGGWMKPSVATCLKLANHFGVAPNELLALAGHKPLDRIASWREGENLQLSRIEEELANLQG